MKHSSNRISFFIILAILALSMSYMGCKKAVNPIKYQYGTFPDSVYNLDGLNTAYDDYNSDLYVLGNQVPIIFSSNRGSHGGQFDLINGVITYQFDQTNGNFTLSSEMSSDPFYATVATKANTTGDDFGPYSFYSNATGYEYLFLASQVSGGQLDLYYEKYLPKFGATVPSVTGPNPVTVLNSSSDDAYISFDSDQDTAYFCSNRGGNFDILLHARPDSVSIDTWLGQSFSASILVDSLNSSYDDKFPFVYKNIMVFSSDRPGGMGGFDLYYSVFKDGKWNAPINFGPRINTSSDEFRPVLGYTQDFTNKFMVFSSNRPGGKGGLDLYFTGFPLPN